MGGEHKPSPQKSTVLKPAEPANLQERKKAELTTEG
jgi:hypothetical protein